MKICHSALCTFADWQYLWPKDIQLTAECLCSLAPGRGEPHSLVDHLASRQCLCWHSTTSNRLKCSVGAHTIEWYASTAYGQLFCSFLWCHTYSPHLTAQYSTSKVHPNIHHITQLAKEKKIETDWFEYPTSTSQSSHDIYIFSLTQTTQP